MSAYKGCKLPDGRAWAVGFDTYSRRDIIVPVHQLDGMSDAEIGRRVRGLVYEATELMADCLLDHGDRWLEQVETDEIESLIRILDPWAERGADMCRTTRMWLRIELDRREEREKAKEKRRQRERRGYVYLAYCETGHYKIGRSKDPNGRIKQFDTQMPVEITLIHTIKVDDAVQLESTLHEHFSDKRVSGEWFDLDPGDVDYIKNMG